MKTVRGYSGSPSPLAAAQAEQAVPLAQDPQVRAQAPDLVRGFGDVPVEVVAQALGRSREALLGMDPAGRAALVGAALTQPGGMAVLAVQLGASGAASTGLPLDERHFRMEYKGWIQSEDRATYGRKDLDAAVKDVGTFRAKAGKLVKALGDHRVSEVLTAASRLTDGQIGSVTQIGKLPAAERHALIHAIIAAIQRPVPAASAVMLGAGPQLGPGAPLAEPPATAPTSVPAVGVSSAIAVSTAPERPVLGTGPTNEVVTTPAAPVDNAPNAAAEGAQKGSLFGRWARRIGAAAAGVALATGLFLATPVQAPTPTQPAAVETTAPRVAPAPPTPIVAPVDGTVVRSTPPPEVTLTDLGPRITPFVEPVGSARTQSIEVKKGDTLWDLAHANGLTFGELWSMNPSFKRPDLIFPGQVVVVSGAERQMPVYQVERGDSLSSLAERFDLRMADLLRANPNLRAQSRLNVGDEVYIPILPEQRVPASATPTAR